MTVTGTQALEPSSAHPGALSTRWIQSEAVGTPTGKLTQGDDTSGGLTPCAIMPDTFCCFSFPSSAHISLL